MTITPLGDIDELGKDRGLKGCIRRFYITQRFCQRCMYIHICRHFRLVSFAAVNTNNHDQPRKTPKDTTSTHIHTMAAESTGHRIFRNALLAESTLNLTAMIPMLFTPETVLSYIVNSHSQITPLSKSLVQWT